MPSVSSDQRLICAAGEISNQSSHVSYVRNFLCIILFNRHDPGPVQRGCSSSRFPSPPSQHLTFSYNHNMHSLSSCCVPVCAKGFPGIISPHFHNCPTKQMLCGSHSADAVSNTSSLVPDVLSFPPAHPTTFPQIFRETW